MIINEHRQQSKHMEVALISHPELGDIKVFTNASNDYISHNIYHLPKILSNDPLSISLNLSRGNLILVNGQYYVVF